MFRLCCAVAATSISSAVAGPEPSFNAIRAREIGPALTSGRIGDIAVNPDNHAEWYVAASSGGVWKTTDNGVTFDPIFDRQGSYSIGCLAMDPANTNVIWVGSGENNSQRSVSFGDGVYKSVDGGKSFRNVGLKESEHIGMIAIDPRDSDRVFVAAQGPLWNDGGERGLYRTEDGGDTWERVLHISDKTGINEVHIDPDDPDTMYCSSYQRRRHVWTLINGGPESTIYRSTDGGDTWHRSDRGLPGGDKGRIGLDISPADPHVVYAIVEAQGNSSGFYRSSDRGETWSRMSDYISSSPQYYNEIVCHPHDVDTIYVLDTRTKVSHDGGRTMESLSNRGRHVDDHALWIDPTNTDHFVIGGDGGLYETWNGGRTFNWKENLPITQFYRVAVDNAEPFYNVYGGTQDNNTLGGPSRTTYGYGSANEDWIITVGGDGFEPAIDPEDPDIVYSQWQYGGLVRHDRRSGVNVDIKPIEKPGEDPYVFNWDSPLLISPHSNTRLYFGSDRLHRSDDRGDSWTVISPRLTRGVDRNTLPVMGEIQKTDAVAKHMSTSIYGNLVALSESPLVEGLIYVGSDDGQVSVTEDGGETWRSEQFFPGVPDHTYVSALYASIHDENTVYACFDNHKNGDFAPYILKSTDRGNTWEDMAGDLGDREICYSIAQDHVDSDLFFLGTEFGAWFSRDHGETWTKIGGIPTIAVRDVDIQRRENDVAFATFGRGFYILDDYSPMQHADEADMDAKAYIYPVRDALLYSPASRSRGSQGSSFYTASNPPYGAVFTYNLNDSFESMRSKRQKAEARGKMPSIDELRAETKESSPRYYMEIRDADDNVLQRMNLSSSKGTTRTAWNLRQHGWSSGRWGSNGPVVLPGTYTATVMKEHDGEVTELSEPREFDVVALNLGRFEAEDRAEVLEFRRRAGRLQGAVSGAGSVLDDAVSRLRAARGTFDNTPGFDPALLGRIDDLMERAEEIRIALQGDPIFGRHQMPSPTSLSRRVSMLLGDFGAMTPPTRTHRDGYEYAAEAFEGILKELRSLVDHVAEVESELDEAGAPWTPGRFPKWERE